MGFRLDRCGFSVSGAPGTGNVTVGAALADLGDGAPGRTPAQAGSVDGRSYRMLFLDGTAWEESDCVTSLTSTVLARTLVRSSTGALLSLTSAAKGYQVPTADDVGLVLLRTTTLTSSGTWTPTGDAVLYAFELIGGGGGGGAGYRGGTAANREGGGGAAGGAVTIERLPASQIAASCAYTIGAGGTGGVAPTTDSTAGGNGGAGGASSIQVNANLTLYASGGAAGSGGTNGAGGAGGAGYTASTASQSPNQGGAAGAVGAVGNNAATLGATGPGGGGGGGGSTTAAARGGGAGAKSTLYSYGTAPVGAANGGGAVTAGGVGGNGSPPYFGEGGGGGGSAFTAGNVAGAGGAGGIPGGGGGGAGSQVNGTTGGAGGAGARGEIRIYEFG